MMQVSFQGVDQLLAALNRAGRELTVSVEEQARAAGEYVQDTMKANAKLVTGSLRESISSDFRRTGNSVEVEVGPVDSQFGGNYAGAAIESGRTPGRRMPPADVLSMRYGLALRDAFAVARSIGRKGTTGSSFVQQTFRQVQTKLADFAGQVIYQVANTIARS